MVITVGSLPTVQGSIPCLAPKTNNAVLITALFHNESVAMIENDL